MAAKIQIPDELKRELPSTLWGRILGATPIVMTVIATLLAGLASSEMTKAQYDRAMAAQLQAKAGDQWAFFQAKRLRSAMARNTVSLLAATGEQAPLAAEALAGLDRAVVDALAKGRLPAAQPAKHDPAVEAALAAAAGARPDSEVAAMVAKLSDVAVGDALVAAKEAANAFDLAIRPINQAIDRLEEVVTGDRQVVRDLSVARLRYAAARYDTEARLNQSIAGLYELQVTRSNLSAEHHHRRSTNFFFGMLAAQAAVIVATFSIAARRRSFLWSLAASAGLAAVSFAAYVYFYI